MALAVLELLDADGGDLVFAPDIGTNTAWRLDIGRGVEPRDGEPRLLDIYHVVAQRTGELTGAQPWEAERTLRVSRRVLRAGPAFAQLVSWKPGGRATAVSDIVDLAGVAAMDSRPSFTAVKARTQSVSKPDDAVCLPARSVAHRRPALAQAASLDGLIGEIVKLAAPLVTQLLQQASGGPAAPPGGAALGGLMQVLQSLLGGLAAPQAGGAPLVKPQSLGRIVRADGGNRFLAGGPRHVAEPFIFGIDDALIASLVGPVLQVLPQLMNAANNKRIELKKADNALMAGIVSDVQKRLMLEKLLESQRAAQAQGPAAEIDPSQIEALIGLLGALPAAPAPAAAGTPAVAKAKSLSAAEPPAARPVQASDRAVLSFEFGAATPWAGTELPLFRRGQPLVLRPRLVVARNAPKAPLPKALLRVQMRDVQHPELRVEKTFKLRDLQAGVPVDCAFDAAELAPLPEQTRLTVLAQLRWPHARGGPDSAATGAADIALVGPAFVRQRGGDVDSEREPTDMARFRSFWNKVWQSRAAGGARLWELDVQARLSALVDNRHDSNALMETRLLAAAPDAAAVSARTEGRMKAGIELSLAELNKLLPLWNGRPPLDADTLAALGARPLLADAGREAFARLRLKGRAGQTGMVWAVPVFRLQGYTLSRVSDVDERGQVRATAETEIAFPMPVALRVLGLKAAT